MARRTRRDFLRSSGVAGVPAAAVSAAAAPARGTQYRSTSFSPGGNLIAHEPTMICPGHGRPYPVDCATMEATEQKFRRQQQLFLDILPEGEVDSGLDPSWVKIYPYQILLGPGETQRLEIRVPNYNPAPMNIEVALVAPSEWKIHPEVVKLRVPAKARGHAPVSVTVPKGWTGPRLAIAGEVMRDGRYLGKITEAAWICDA